MSTAYSTPGAFPTLVVLFSCRCGRQAVSAGLTRSLPRGWVETSAERDEHLCPECASRYSEAFARSK